MSAIRLAGVTKCFGRTVAVDAVTLRIEPGELFFLLGPSGCGKTTLLRMVAGFTSPEAGQLYFGDQCVTSVPPQRRDCGMVFQNYALWPHMSVADNVAFGLEVRRLSGAERRRRVQEALCLVHMEELADRKPGELSGGQQQRVALARALVIRPRCLLLDEPLSNLDAKLRVEMRSEIRRLCKQLGLTTLYVTHDQKEALSTADRIALMRDGAVVQCDTPSTLYRAPATRFAADFLGEANFLRARVAELRDGVALVETLLGRFTIRAATLASLLNGSQAGQGGRVCGQRRVSGSPSSRAGEARPVAEGRELGCALRPEAVHVGHAPPKVGDSSGQAVEFEATVVESTYLGDAVQYLLDVGDCGLRLRALETNPRGATLAGGAALWFSTEDLIFLAD